MPRQERSVRVGIDFDKVLVQHTPTILGSIIKNSYPVEGAQQALQFLLDDSKIHPAIYTKRLRWLRGFQTRRTLQRYNFPTVDIHFGRPSHTSKLISLFEHASIDPGAQSLQPCEELKHIILIDDSGQGLVTAAKKLAKNPRYEKMLALFTLIAFNCQPVTIDETTKFRVLQIKSWGEIESLITSLKNPQASLDSK